MKERDDRFTYPKKIKVSKKNKDGVATIIQHSTFQGEDALKIFFYPGLPHDPRTKGMPHKDAFCLEITIQDHETQHKTSCLVLCGHYKKGPNLTDIYKMKKNADLDDVKTWMDELGYELIDAVANKEQALITSARVKLTEEERNALGI